MRADLGKRLEVPRPPGAKEVSIRDQLERMHCLSWPIVAETLQGMVVTQETMRMPPEPPGFPASLMCQLSAMPAIQNLSCPYLLSLLLFPPEGWKP